MAREVPGHTCAEPGTFPSAESPPPCTTVATAGALTQPPSSVSLRSWHSREKATWVWGPYCPVHPWTGALWIRQGCFWLQVQKPSWLYNKTWRFFTPEIGRVVAQLLVLMSAMLGWCLYDVIDLFLTLTSWLLLLQPSCPHSEWEEDGKGWHKLSPAKQKLSQRVANRLLLTSHWPGPHGHFQLRGCRWGAGAGKEKISLPTFCSSDKGERNVESSYQVS